MNKCIIKNLSRKKQFSDDIFTTWIESFDAITNDRNYHIDFAFRQLKTDGYNSEIGVYADGFRRMIDRWQNLVKENSIAIDIGAYNGDSTMPLGCLVGGGLVFAFEPGLFYNFLNINCGLNPNLKIIPLNYAVMEDEGIHEFLYSADCENGGPKLNTSLIGSYKEKRLVRSLNLIEFLNKHKIDFNNISFIKLDTEGYDMKILQNIHDLIRRIRCPIQIEWFHNTTNDIVNFIKENNYHSVDCRDNKGYTILPPAWTDDLLLIPN